MTPQSFVDNYYSFAKQAERKTGIPALFSLAQSALESGWGKHAPGNMFFGIKTGSGKSFGGWQGQKQLVTTAEYSTSPTLKFPQILPGYPKKEGDKYKYMVKDYFRSYPSPLFSFLDWSGMLAGLSRYAKAMQTRHDPFLFAEQVAKAGYATDPAYAKKVIGVMRQLAPLVKSQKTARSIWPLITVILVACGTITLGYGIFMVVKNQKSNVNE